MNQCTVCHEPVDDARLTFDCEHEMHVSCAALDHNVRVCPLCHQQQQHAVQDVELDNVFVPLDVGDVPNDLLDVAWTMVDGKRVVSALDVIDGGPLVIEHDSVARSQLPFLDDREHAHHVDFVNISPQNYLSGLASALTEDHVNAVGVHYARCLNSFTLQRLQELLQQNAVSCADLAQAGFSFADLRAIVCVDRPDRGVVTLRDLEQMYGVSFTDLLHFSDVCWETFLNAGLTYNELAYHLDQSVRAFDTVAAHFGLSWTDVITDVVRPHAVALDKRDAPPESEFYRFLDLRFDQDTLELLSFSTTALFRNMRVVSRRDFVALCRQFDLRTMVERFGLCSTHLYRVHRVTEQNVAGLLFVEIGYAERDVRDLLQIDVAALSAQKSRPRLKIGVA